MDFFVKFFIPGALEISKILAALDEFFDVLTLFEKSIPNTIAEFTRDRK